MKLADPLHMSNPEIVKQFYANSYYEDSPREKRSKVRGRWVIMIEQPSVNSLVIHYH